MNSFRSRIWGAAPAPSADVSVTLGSQDTEDAEESTEEGEYTDQTLSHEPLSSTPASTVPPPDTPTCGPARSQLPCDARTRVFTCSTCRPLSPSDAASTLPVRQEQQP